VYISGRVQGVFFRQNIQLIARSSKVKGWVTNLPDGRVEAVFEGEKPAVNAIVDYCRHGPKVARVENLEVLTENYIGEFTDFVAY
jgi:acylphosphatase